MEDIHDDQNQNRPVERSVRPLEKEDIPDAEHQPGDRDRAQSQQVDHFPRPSALPHAQIPQHVRKGRARQSRQRRQLQGIQDVGRQPDPVGIPENPGDVFKGERKVVRKGLREGKADKSDLRKKQHQANRDNQHSCSPVESFSRLDQPLLFFAARILKNQVEHKRNHRRNQQHKPGDAPPPVLKAAHKLVVKVHRKGFHLPRDLHRHPVVRKDQREAREKRRDQRDPQIGNRQPEKSAPPRNPHDARRVVGPFVLIAQRVVEDQKSGRKRSHHRPHDQPRKTPYLDFRSEKQVQKPVLPKQNPQPQPHGDGRHQHPQRQQDHEQILPPQVRSVQKVSGRQRQSGGDDRRNARIDQGIPDRLPEALVFEHLFPVFPRHVERQRQQRQNGKKNDASDRDEPKNLVPDAPGNPPACLHWMLSSMLFTFMSRWSTMNRFTKASAG